MAADAAVAYKWPREGSAISGATSASYVVQSADEGHGLACEVTATNAAGHEASKSSSVTVPVPAITVLSSRLVFVKDTAKASIACANAACAGTAEVIARVGAKHGRKKTVVIAKGSYSLAAGNSTTVAPRLTGAWRKGDAGRQAQEALGEPHDLRQARKDARPHAGARAGEEVKTSRRAASARNGTGAATPSASTAAPRAVHADPAALLAP